MAELVERDFDRRDDLPALLALVADGRASLHPHAFLHPGGLQWLLRRLGNAEFAMQQWFDGDALAGFVIDDSGYVIVQAASNTIEAHLRLLRLAEEGRSMRGGNAVEVSVWDDDRELLASLRSLGYERSGTDGHEAGHELVREVGDVSRPPTLPEGFSMRWLEPHLDDAYVELHRAAWSTVAPSTYDDRAHAAVVTMPQFDRRLVPVIAAPDGILAAYCIAWFDPLTRTSEIEPLGTHPEYRRRGLARAVTQEAVRRSTQRGAESVMVWGVGEHRIALYESAGFRSARVLREYARRL